MKSHPFAAREREREIVLERKSKRWGVDDRLRITMRVPRACANHPRLRWRAYHELQLPINGLLELLMRIGSAALSHGQQPAVGYTPGSSLPPAFPVSRLSVCSGRGRRGQPGAAWRRWSSGRKSSHPAVS
jgi:hypothetical protein